MTAALLATLIVTCIGLATGYVLAKARFRGRAAIEALMTLPIALPPTVVGYYLMSELGGPGPLRDASIALFGRPLTFTVTGIVIAQSVEALPYTLRASRGAISGVDPRLEQAARAMGLPEWRVTLQVTLPLARVGIIAGIAMAFGRALGDYAATEAVAGRVPGVTTMSVALYDAATNGPASKAQILAYVQLSIAVAILVGVSRLGRVKT